MGGVGRVRPGVGAENTTGPQHAAGRSAVRTEFGRGLTGENADQDENCKAAYQQHGGLVLRQDIHQAVSSNKCRLAAQTLTKAA